MAMIWGSQPIMKNVGTIVQVVINNSSTFSYTHVYAANSGGDIFEYQHAKPDLFQKIYVGKGIGASKIANDDTNLYSVLDGVVYKDTSGFYIYKFQGGPKPWKLVWVNDLGSPDLIGANVQLYIIYSVGILRLIDDLSDPAKWEKIGGSGKVFVCNSDTVYGLSGDDSLWQYISGQNWIKIRTQASKDIVAQGHLLCAVDKQSGDILKYNGKPESWTKIGGPGKMFAIDDHDNLYGLTPNSKEVWQFKGQPGSWKQVGGPAGQIFAGGKVLCATSPDNKELWCFRDEG